jgi:hypothetical protein
MSKFEQLLDYLVNEEMDKANELFHEIVVEKSRTIYENLIAEEADEEVEEASDDEMDESKEEEVDEAKEEEVDESEEELEDSYMMDSEDDGFGGGAEGDATDDLGADIEVDGDDMGGDEPEGEEDQAIFDIKNAIADLEAAFAELEQAHGSEEGDMDGEFGDEEGEEDGEEFGDEDEMEMIGHTMEGRRLTREYVEKVGNDWEKNSQKTQGQYVGANSGEGMPAPVEGKSPVSSGKGKPVTGANASNIAKSATGEGAMDGTSPNGKTGGLVKNPQDMKTGNGNVPGGKMGVKNLSKVAGGHGAEKKGSGPGPVGSGSGDKAGQTSVAPIKPFLKKL